jgi:hypothetical protein
MVQMKDAQFMSAEEKLMVLRAWQRFVESGLRKNCFTEALYKHLINHCSFIAHYDRRGFYATYFEHVDDVAHFFTQFDNSKGIPESIEYGGTSWYTDQRYNDINADMCRIATPLIPALTGRAKAEQRAEDIGLARKLLAKHGIEINV